ncbi:MAG: hypothetical protein GXP45_04340 [bacterium]|nr:hypothetical protein [bacterium]
MEKGEIIAKTSKEIVDRRLSYFLSKIKKEYALMLFSLFLSQNIDAKKFPISDSLFLRIDPQIELIYQSYRSKNYPDKFPDNQSSFEDELKNIFSQTSLDHQLKEKIQKKMFQKRFDGLTEEEIFVKLVDRKINKKYQY